MTPEHLRVRAQRNLQTARLCLASDPDNASNLIGQAAELALKARYCRLRGWDDFPATPALLRANGGQEVVTHNLSDLLKVSETIRIVESPSIDWERVCDWSVAQRYDAVGTVDKERAERQLEATAELLDGLEKFEVIEALGDISVAIGAIYGPLSLFAWAKLPHPAPSLASQPPGWYGIVSGWGVLGKERELMVDLDRLMHEHIGADLRARVSGWFAMHPLEYEAGDLAMFMTVDGPNSRVYIENCVLNDRPLLTAYVMSSRFFRSPPEPS